MLKLSPSNKVAVKGEHTKNDQKYGTLRAKEMVNNLSFEGKEERKENNKVVKKGEKVLQKVRIVKKMWIANFFNFINWT